jgi:hypothetical protein
MAEVLMAMAMILAMIYAAAILLAVRDRISPPAPYVPKQPPQTIRPCPRWWRLVLTPLVFFVLSIWLIVYGPVLIWRAMIRGFRPTPPTNT